MRAILRMMRHLDSESFGMLMEIFMKVNGKMIKLMVMENILIM